MKVIFLDIDGVLNSFEKHADLNVPHADWCPEKMAAFGIELEIFPEFVKRLNKITDETGARIVVSSSWRIGYLADWVDVVIHMHNCGIKGFILGRTPWKDEDGHSHVERAQEINHWLEQHKEETLEEMIILDDNDVGKGYDSRCTFIQTHHKHGMQDEHVEQAIAKLNASVV